MAIFRNMQSGTTTLHCVCRFSGLCRALRRAASLKLKASFGSGSSSVACGARNLRVRWRANFSHLFARSGSTTGSSSVGRSWAQLADFAASNVDRFSLKELQSRLLSAILQPWKTRHETPRTVNTTHTKCWPIRNMKQLLSASTNHTAGTHWPQQPRHNIHQLRRLLGGEYVGSIHATFLRWLTLCAAHIHAQTDVKSALFKHFWPTFAQYLPCN